MKGRIHHPASRRKDPMNPGLKWFFRTALLFAFACQANESLQGPPWMKIQPNGTFAVDDVRAAIGVNDGRRGASETAANSKFEKCPDTIELDSRIWQTSFRPFSPGPASTLQKKLTVFSDGSVNWRYTFLGADKSGIRGVGVDLTFPARERELAVDGKKVSVGAKFSKVILYRGKCRVLSIPVSGSTLEFSGDFDLTVTDLRKWGTGNIIITFTMKEQMKPWKKAGCEFDIRYRGVRVAREVFEQSALHFTPVSLHGVLNSTTWDDAADDGRSGWTDKGPEDDLRLFRCKGRTVLNGIPFEIADPAQNNGKNIIGVCHPKLGLNLPASVTIPLKGIKGGGLYFLHAASWANASPGSYIVRYEDGSETAIPLRNFDNIFNWWSVGTSPSAAIGWIPDPKGDSRKGLVLYPWRNPHPDKPMSSLIMKMADNAPQSMLMLAGITAVDRDPVIPAEDEGAPIDDSHWLPYTGVDEKAVKNTVLDVSEFVPAPAGKFGFVRADGATFRFENGREARFMGMCVLGFFQCDKPYLTAAIAKLRRMGVNIVRVGVGGDEPGGIFRNDGTMEFEPKRLDHFFFYLAELKKNGIYIQLDLLPSRGVKKFENPELEGVRWYPGVFVMPQIRARQKELISLLLNTVNPYTGLPLAKDPMLAMLMALNETSLLDQPVRDKLAHPLVKAELRKKFNAFLLKRYPGRAALKTAWKGSLGDAEDPVAGTVEIPVDYNRHRYSKEREVDCRKFMAALQSEYFREIRDHVRSLGCVAPITGSNHWTTDPLDFLSNAESTDFIDRHAYWAHPAVDNGWGIEQILFNPNASLKGENGGLMAYITPRRVAGKPFTLTEWNVASTNEFRADAQLYLPAYALMHGWNLFQFLFNLNRALQPPTRIGSAFDLERDALQLAMWPATAVMFHRRDVRRSSKEYVETLASGEAADPRGKRFDSARIARAGLCGRAGIAFDSAPGGGTAPAPGAKSFTSPERELFWEERGLFRIDTPGTQAFAGFAPKETIRCRDIEFNTENDFAVVIVTSRDNRPLQMSGRILMTAVARCWNTGMKYARLRNRVAKQGVAPQIFQPVKGTVKLRTAKKLDVYALDFSGRRTARIDCEYRNGVLTVPIGSSVHYELTKSASAPGTVPEVKK